MDSKQVAFYLITRFIFTHNKIPHTNSTIAIDDKWLRRKAPIFHECPATITYKAWPIRLRGIPVNSRAC